MTSSVSDFAHTFFKTNAPNHHVRTRTFSDLKKRPCALALGEANVLTASVALFM
ncbi:hypothetical protein HK096_001023 [Nowakowskiella sp. JEL0078]|nr:hypothetical protein HK096_001023 [Nowakowskiella sp. JEL0078]